MTLRKRLVLSMTALIALASVLIGIALPLIMRGFLLDRLDQQLFAAASRAGTYDDRDRDRDGPGGRPGGGPPATTPQGLLQPGQAVGTVAALSVNGSVTDCGLIGADGESELCTTEMVGELAKIDDTDRPETVHLDGIGDYRLVAFESESGQLIVGLPISGTSETVKRLIVVELIVVGVVLVLAAVAATIVIGRNLRPLRRVAATAKRVSELPLHTGDVDLAERVAQRDADPSTEVGQVGAALNQLLSHVEDALESRQRSEARVRSFVADASHELRTPLAAIRGYAELTRRSTDEVPEDIRYALRRVESESARMTALVEDLLLLARLDAGRPLARDPVDLSALLINAVSDAHAAGPDHVWELDLPEESVTVTGDVARLHQVIANLLANARTHTPPGTVVTAALRPAPGAGSVELVVHDDGPGIPADLQPQVFDRFARGDSSRSRAQGSTGLGLAIVAAVVASHGGSVSVESTPGDTTFVVRLPSERPVGERIVK